MDGQFQRQRYLTMLSRQYPTIQAASSEIINLQAILNLPKGTEHFMSDLHGEYEAFLHILSNASGAIREKVDMLYENTLTRDQRASLATLIYYPEEKLKEARQSVNDMNEWYKITLHRLLDICRLISSKYTRSKVRKALPKEYAYIIDELLHTNYSGRNKKDYYENIIATIIRIGCAEAFVRAVCGVIKTLVVDHLHIVGDIFDRGPRADIIMDSLMQHHSVDIQWGNHDALWMGAATGSRACIAIALCNSLIYNNLEVVETGYGISLRPLALFANEFYENVDTSCFAVRSLREENTVGPKDKDIEQAARMHKAIAVIQFKLEGQILLRRPEYNMGDRLLLDKIDFKNGAVEIKGKMYALADVDFPTINPQMPYALTPEESGLMDQLAQSFMQSEKLQRHVKFLYSKGGLYKCYNGNLLFHGCIPMNEDGSFMRFDIGCDGLSGKVFMDHAETLARQGYYAPLDSDERLSGQDFLWFLWCGRNSPLFGREQITTFERRLVLDKSVRSEPKNPYYHHYNSEEVCEQILKEFDLEGSHCHIINGHVPVKTKEGESPVKAHGRLVVIDGGFCRAYQPTTGIGGYTLIFNSWGTKLASHEPFSGREDAIRSNKDIISTTAIFDRVDSRIKIAETDIGAQLQASIGELTELLRAYRSGEIKENHETRLNI